MSERRIRWLLLLLLFGQLILLTSQIPDPGGESSALEATTLRLVAPLAGLVAASSELLTEVGHGLATQRRLAEENRTLRREVERLERETVRLFGVDEDLRRLEGAVDYARQAPAPLRVADILFIDHVSPLQTLVISLGESENVVNRPVLASEGLVGRVVVASGPYAKVQLITDRSASVGAMIRRTRRQGVVRGAGRGRLDLDYIPLQADVRVGDLVLSAGIDGIYPRGIPIGTVTSIEPGSELFHRIRVQPQVDFGLLDQVYVLGREPVPEEVREADLDAEP